MLVIFFKLKLKKIEEIVDFWSSSFEILNGGFGARIVLTN